MPDSQCSVPTQDGLVGCGRAEPQKQVMRSPLGGVALLQTRQTEGTATKIEEEEVAESYASKPKAEPEEDHFELGDMAKTVGELRFGKESIPKGSIVKIGNIVRGHDAPYKIYYLKTGLKGEAKAKDLARLPPTKFSVGDYVFTTDDFKGALANGWTGTIPEGALARVRLVNQGLSHPYTLTVMPAGGVGTSYAEIQDVSDKSLKLHSWSLSKLNIGGQVKLTHAVTQVTTMKTFPAGTVFKVIEIDRDELDFPYRLKSLEGGLEVSSGVMDMERIEEEK